MTDHQSLVRSALSACQCFHKDQLCQKPHRRRQTAGSCYQNEALNMAPIVPLHVQQVNLAFYDFEGNLNPFVKVTGYHHVRWK